MSEGTLRKIGESTEPMYGPRALLICGFTPVRTEYSNEINGCRPA